MAAVGERLEIKITSSADKLSSGSAVAGTPPTSLFQSSTPVEILTEIFSYLPWDIPPASRARGRFPSWFAVSHVCRQWRIVALDYPSLWEYLPLESTTWTSVALERTNLGFIRIDAGPDVFSDNGLIKLEALDIAMAEAQRATDLAITMHGYQMAMRIFGQLTTLDASAMVDLHLVFRRPRLDDTPNFSNTLFSATTPPNLRVLRLLGLAVQPGCPLFTSSLTHLELDKATAWESLVEMFGVLAGLPHLTHLLLRRGEYGSALPSWESPDPLLNDGVMGRSIVFPRLKLLHISGDTSVTIRTLQVLRAPACAELEVEYFEDWIDVGLEIFPAFVR
ncbi:hypothetical protein OF83DRAFT_616528 [Amylostereum chailletii]|nr:hypothetical protein OF83DRAFT_616528 [Amylostereum chailletii]